MNSLGTAPARRPIALCPPINGHPGGPISHGNPGSSRLPSDSAGRSWFGWRNAGRRNRFPMDCAGSILETQRCRSRMKPSMAISMGYPLTPSSAPSPGTSGGGIAFGGPASPGSPPAPSRRWSVLMPGQPSGGAHRAGALGRRLARRPCQRVSAGDARRTHHPVYPVGPVEGQACNGGAAGLLQCGPCRPQLRRSLTYDQGQEMRDHRRFTTQTKMPVYFAHPHSPWERGTNENTNGLLRQFFPAGTHFNKVSRGEIERVQTMLNDRPRKITELAQPSACVSPPVALGS